MSQKAMKLALDEIKNQKDELEEVGITDHSLDEIIKALEEALANHCEDNLNMVEQEQGEPVAWNLKDVTDAYKLGAKSQQRTWVGLTDEQIKHIYISTTGWSISDSDPMLVDFARAIEAAHGIKE